MKVPVPDAALRDAIAATTCWFADDRDRGVRVAATAIDRDPTAFLEALGGLLTVLHDVCLGDRVDLATIVRDVALGVAQAEAEALPHPDQRPGDAAPRRRPGPSGEPGGAP